MAAGSGLASVPFSSRPSAMRVPALPPWPAICAIAMHSELVKNRSTSSVVITGPGRRRTEQRGEQRHAHETGVGPDDRQCAQCGILHRHGVRVRVSAIVANTSTIAVISVMTSTTGLMTCATGSDAPNRNSMHGSAKYSTKMLRPGIAASGSRRAAARQITAQDQREERDRDRQDGLHGPEVSQGRTAPRRPARPGPASGNGGWTSATSAYRPTAFV